MMRIPAVLSIGALAVFGLGLVLSFRASGASAYTLSAVEYGMQLKTPDGRVVFEYMTKKPANIGLTSPSVACFHPVNTPSGERITSIAPDDHPHHRGIFFGWHDSEFREPANFANYGPHAPVRGFNIRRADFWGWGEYAPREGRVVQNQDVKLVRADANRAEIEIHNDWNVGNRKMLDEVNTVTAFERDGVFVLDLDYRLTPVVDYFIDRASFGGFDVQCRKDGESYYSNAAGKVTLPDPHYSLPELDWPSAPWYDYTIRLAGSGKTLGAAVIDHPRNPPTTWHNSTHLWMLNPTITGAGSQTIKGGTTMTLRYRVVTHDGAPPTEVLQKLAAEYRR
jgi:hypothetical protein